MILAGPPLRNALEAAALLPPSSHFLWSGSVTVLDHPPGLLEAGILGATAQAWVPGHLRIAIGTPAHTTAS